MLRIVDTEASVWTIKYFIETELTHAIKINDCLKRTDVLKLMYGRFSFPHFSTFGDIFRETKVSKHAEKNSNYSKKKEKDIKVYVVSPVTSSGHVCQWALLGYV